MKSNTHDTPERLEGHRECPLPAPEHSATAPRRAYAWLKTFFCALGRARSFGLASEMAFWLFLSLIPLAAVAGLVVARLAVGNEDIANPFLSSAPDSVQGLVAKQLGRVAKWNGGTVAPLAAAIFVWLASSGIHSIFDGLEVQVGTERPWWKKRLLAIATCVALSVGVALIALLGTGLQWVFDLAGAEIPAAVKLFESHLLARILRIVVGVLVLFGLIAGLYAVGVPPAARRRMPLAPGAVLAVSLHIVMGVGYGIYLSQMGTGDAYLAGLAVVGVTLMALYLFCVALLVGAEFNQLVGERRRREKPPPRRAAVAPPLPARFSRA